MQQRGAGIPAPRCQTQNCSLETLLSGNERHAYAAGCKQTKRLAIGCSRLDHVLPINGLRRATELAPAILAQKGCKPGLGQNGAIGRRRSYLATSLRLLDEIASLIGNLVVIERQCDH